MGISLLTLSSPVQDVQVKFNLYKITSYWKYPWKYQNTSDFIWGVHFTKFLTQNLVTLVAGGYTDCWSPTDTNPQGINRYTEDGPLVVEDYLPDTSTVKL